MHKQLCLLFVVRLLLKCADSQDADPECRQYGFRKRVFPASLYAFQKSEVVVILRYSQTVDACQNACLEDGACAGLFLDLRNQKGDSGKGQCVLIPKDTLRKLTDEEEGKVPKAVLSSLAKYCREYGKDEKPGGGQTGESSTEDVNFILYMYGVVTLAVGIILVFVAAFLFRKVPPKDAKAPDPKKLTLDINMKDYFQDTQKARKKRKKKKHRRGSESSIASSIASFFRKSGKGSRGSTSTNLSKESAATSRDSGASGASRGSSYVSETHSQVSGASSMTGSLAGSDVSAGVDWEEQRRGSHHHHHRHPPPHHQQLSQQPPAVSNEVAAFSALGSAF